MTKRVMIVDHSARAHALADAYIRSGNEVVMTEGNDFAAHVSKDSVILAKEANHKNPESVLAAAKKYEVGFVDVCQDDALALGTVDLLTANNILAFGPTKAAARLEWDKAWARDFMRMHNIPHPEFITCESEEYGVELAKQIYSGKKDKLTFIKASGLCAGKGAVPAANLDEAIKAIESMKSFGAAGKTFLIEEGMIGEEASVYAICDDWNIKITKPAQDHKRLLWGDQGPNTGGMGAVAPAGLITPELESRIAKEIIIPTVNGMRMHNSHYTGVLYVGVIATKDGPKVVEFNSRWGAPEAEVVIPGIQTPMDDIVYACNNKKLQNLDFKEDGKTRVCIVGAVKGYPDSNAVKAMKGKYINGLDLAMQHSGIKVYGAGIEVKDGKFYVNGGRLFSLVAEADSIKLAQAKALSAIENVYVEGNNLHYRTDIGWRDIQREGKK